MDGPVRDRRRVRRHTFPILARVALLAALAGLITSCGIGRPSGAGWHDANLHVVDGIWITGEKACGPTSADDRCRAARPVAVAAVRDSEGPQPSSVTIARVPHEWVNDRGEQILMTTGGISKPVVAIVDLADGRRVAVGLMCDPTIGGNPARPATCFVVPDVLDPYRVDGHGPNPFGAAP